jgi:hypothetical protein
MEKVTIINLVVFRGKTRKVVFKAMCIALGRRANRKLTGQALTML